MRIRKRLIIDRDNLLLSEAQPNLLHRDVFDASCRTEFLHLNVQLLADVGKVKPLFHAMVSIFLAMLRHCCSEVRLIEIREQVFAF